MARTLGASAERMTTPAELEGAMARAEADPGAFRIEAVTARDYLSPVMARILYISTPHQSPGLFEHLVCRRPWPKAVIAGGTAPSIGPRVVGNVLDGNDRVELTAACVGHGQLPQGDSIEVSENVVRGGGQEQPGTSSQLVLELGGTPARMTQKEDAPVPLPRQPATPWRSARWRHRLRRRPPGSPATSTVGRPGPSRFGGPSCRSSMPARTQGAWRPRPSDAPQLHVQLAVQYQTQGSVCTVYGNEDHRPREVGVGQRRGSDQQLPLK